MSAKRTAACNGCGKRGKTAGLADEYLCRPCVWARKTGKQIAPAYTDAHALTGGQWQWKDGIARWVPDPEPAKPIRTSKQECGQSRGAYRHRKNGEKPCAKCRAAEAAARAEHRRRKTYERHAA